MWGLRTPKINTRRRWPRRAMGLAAGWRRHNLGCHVAVVPNAQFGRLVSGCCRGANMCASVVPTSLSAMLPKSEAGACPCCCCRCHFRPLPSPLSPSSSSCLLDLSVPPMQAADSDACVAVGVSSYIKARLMRILVMWERIPRLVLVIPACRRVSASSRQLFFKTAHIFIIVVVTSVSSGRHISLSQPSLSFHRLHGHAPSSTSSLPLAKHHCPSSVASTDVSVCAHRNRPPPPPGCALGGRRTAAAGGQNRHRPISPVK